MKASTFWDAQKNGPWGGGTTVRGVCMDLCRRHDIGRPWAATGKLT